ncbi:MAG: hypothetical protein WAO07_15005, partial [Desulfobacterales bacterium]
LRSPNKLFALPQNRMSKEYDFSKGERGKFYHPDMKLNIPIYLDEEVSAFIEKIASKKGIDRSIVVNELLRGDIKIPRLWNKSPSANISFEQTPNDGVF